MRARVCGRVHSLSGKVKQFPVLCCVFTFISSIVLLVEVV
jgi:hypothetical protein